MCWGIIAVILVARHLKTTGDLHDSRPSPRTESLVASAVQWAKRIMRRIDGTFANSRMTSDGRELRRDPDFSVETGFGRGGQDRYAREPHAMLLFLLKSSGPKTDPTRGSR